MKMEYPKSVLHEKNCIKRFEYKLGMQLRNLLHVDNQPERLSERDRCNICEGTLLEYEKLTRICDNCDYKKSICDSPNTATKGGESNGND